MFTLLLLLLLLSSLLGYKLPPDLRDPSKQANVRMRTEGKQRMEKKKKRITKLTVLRSKWINHNRNLWTYNRTVMCVRSRMHVSKWKLILYLDSFELAIINPICKVISLVCAWTFFIDVNPNSIEAHLNSYGILNYRHFWTYGHRFCLDIPG